MYAVSVQLVSVSSGCHCVIVSVFVTAYCIAVLAAPKGVVSVFVECSTVYAFFGLLGDDG